MTMYSPQWKENLAPNVYNARDIEYFQGMYPQRIKTLQKYIMLHCDTMDYKGSPIYDEYPDPLLIDRACAAICRGLPQELSVTAMPGTTVPSDWPDEEQAEPDEGGRHQTEAVQEPALTGNLPVAATALGERPPGGPPPWGPPPGGPPPWGPPPGGPPPWGPPPGGPPPWGPPPGGPPPWGPPPGGRPPEGPPWGPPPGGPPPGGRPPGGPPPWGPPPGGPPQNGGWLSDIVKVLFMNELQRRRCRNGIC